MSSSVDSVLKKFSDYVQYANVPIERSYFQFSLPTLNLICSGDLKGLRSGSIVQLVGKKSTGKTTLAFDLIVNAQNVDRTCAFVDFEHTFDPDYASELGIQLEKLIYVHPDTAEKGLMIVEALIDSGVHLIVIDSVAAMLPKDELEKTYEDNPKMAASAGLITRFLKRITGKVSHNNTLIVLINQMRANVSLMARKETKPFGGYALEHGLQVSLELSRIGTKDNLATIQVFAEKNKQGKERQKTEVFLDSGKGFRADIDTIDLCIEKGIIKQKGAWLEYGDSRAQGKENACSTLPLYELRSRLQSIFDS